MKFSWTYADLLRGQAGEYPRVFAGLTRLADARTRKSSFSLDAMEHREDRAHDHHHGEDRKTLRENERLNVRQRLPKGSGGGRKVDCCRRNLC